MTYTSAPLAGVIGNPIAQSKSPILFRHWLKKYGCDGHYIPMPVEEGNDFATDRATLIGAANTLIFRKDGKIHADNTDGYGFIANLKQGAPEWVPSSGPAAVLGAGGAARAVISSLIDVGVQEIFLSNRTRPKAEALKEAFGTKVTIIDWVQAGNMIEDATTVVNTTSLGMQGMPELRVPLDGLRRGTVVTDLVYNPLKTRLLVEAEAAGCVTVDGLGMLLHQAVPGFERWFGTRPEVDADTRAAVLQ